VRFAGALIAAATAGATLLSAGAAQAQIRDACAFLSDRPTWRRDLEAASQTWGVSQGVILAVLDQESRMRADARGAGGGGGEPQRNFGFAQANLSTWNWYLRDTRTQASRTDFAASARFVGWHFATFERRIGQPRENTIQHYLAYKMGEGGYRRGAPESARRLAATVAARGRAHDAALADCAAP
jgi:hypothetical protein